MLLVPQTAAATWRVLRASVSLIFSLCYFPFRSFVLLCLPVAVFLFFFSLLFQLVLFKCSAHRLRGGARQFVPSIYIYVFSFDLSSLFLFFHCFLSFLNFMEECVYRACRIQYDDMALHCPLPCLLHTWQRSISVA